MSNISRYRGNINVYTPPVVNPYPPVVVPPIVNPYPPVVVPPVVDVYTPSRRSPSVYIPGADVGIHTSRRGNEVIDNYRTGRQTTVVEHGSRAGEVIHQRIR